MLLPYAEGGKLLVSGTASIVGHESRHRAIDAQLGETLANVEGLTIAALARLPGHVAGPRRCWRVYLRDPRDLARIEAEVRGRLGGTGEVAFLQADICRRELLVEVEGWCELTRAG
jgi:chorismate lyase/3-hydroxybenzoate synthase